VCGVTGVELQGIVFGKSRVVGYWVWGYGCGAVGYCVWGDRSGVVGYWV